MHSSNSTEERLQAPPLLVFAARPGYRDGRRLEKGFLDFAGVCVIERLEFVVQRDPRSGKSFPNLVVDLVVLRLDEHDEVDWRWIDDRRDADLPASNALEHAPANAHVGPAGASGPARRSPTRDEQPGAEQGRPPPEPGSPDDEVLDEVYRFFDGRKHAFELLASRVAAAVMDARGGAYTAMWLTRSGGDGGMDFVGRLDVGQGVGSSPLVVLGQAKCIRPDSSISPDQVARLVARLRRGWVGIFVTTGVFSRQAQVEIVDDSYPVVLVSGARLAAVVRRSSTSPTAAT